MRDSRLAMVLEAVRVALGLLFTLTGLAKVPVVSELSSTVTEVLRVSEGSGTLIAVSVIVLETLAGISLLLRIRIRLTATFCSLLLAGFCLFLSIALFRGNEVLCRCFGILNVQLPNRVELALDALLSLLCGSLALWFPGGSQESLSHRSGEKWVVTAAAGILLLGVTLYSSFVPGPARTPELLSAIQHLEAGSGDFAARGGKSRVLLLIRLKDFHCSLCFDDFLELCSQLEARLGQSELARVGVLFSRDQEKSLEDASRAYRWARETGIVFPFVVVPESILESMAISKSAVALLDEENQTRVFRELPLGPEGRKLLTDQVRP